MCIFLRQIAEKNLKKFTYLDKMGFLVRIVLHIVDTKNIWQTGYLLAVILEVIYVGIAHTRSLKNMQVSK